MIYRCVQAQGQESAPLLGEKCPAFELKSKEVGQTIHVQRTMLSLARVYTKPLVEADLGMKGFILVARFVTARLLGGPCCDG